MLASDYFIFCNMRKKSIYIQGKHKLTFEIVEKLVCTDLWSMEIKVLNEMLKSGTSDTPIFIA